MADGTDTDEKVVTLYTTDFCASCMAAKALLKRRGVPYREVHLSRSAEDRDELRARTGLMTFPQLVIGERTIGGFQDIVALDRQGSLEELKTAA